MEMAIAVQNLSSPEVPLHRLLKRKEAAALLAEFETLLPGGKLALMAADAHIYAGYADWDQAELQKWQVRLSADRLIRADHVVLRPIFIQSQYMGALVAHADASLGSASQAEQVVNCLHTSLTMLLNQALEKRDVVSETLARYREVNLLYHIGEAIGGCLETDEIPQLVLDELHRIIQADVGAVILSAESVADATEDAGTAARRVAASFGDEQYVRILREICDEAIERAAATGQPTIIDQSCSPQPVDKRIGTILCVPIKTPEYAFGSLVLGRLAGQPEFTAGDGKLTMVLAHQAAISLEAARMHQAEVRRQRLEEELAIGRQIQLSLLPRQCPTVPGWEFAAVYLPARQVGGDLYDFVQLPDAPGQLGMVIADVTGKGIPAALFMAFSRTVIRNEAMNGRSPATILQRANRLITQDIHSRLFLSALYAVLDTNNGRLVYANGGHDWPLWFQVQSGATHWLDVHSFILGAFDEVDLEERTLDVNPGDILVFYTDGVTEARSPAGDLFGEERLMATIQANAQASPQQLQEALLAAINQFTAGQPLADDLTFFIVKRRLDS
jgi:serine phosphatase RsbU (regulator of sigma subunit)